PAHRGGGDQLVERLPAFRQREAAFVLERPRPGAPVPQPRRLPRVLDLLRRPQGRAVERHREQPVVVEGEVVRRQADTVERPEEHAETLGLPDRVDHRRLVSGLREPREGLPDDARQRAATADDLAPAAELRHVAEVTRWREAVAIVVGGGAYPGARGEGEGGGDPARV